MVELSVRVPGLEFKNPLVVESAGYTVDAWGLKRMVKAGFAGVITKSTTWDPMGGWPRVWENSPQPRVFWYTMKGTRVGLENESGYVKVNGEDMFTTINGSEALQNPGIHKMCEFIKEATPVAKEHNAHLIGSFSPRNVEEGQRMAQMFQEAGASAVHMDLQCPTAAPFRSKQFPGQGYDVLGSWWSETPERTAELIRAIKKAVDIPVWPKPLLYRYLRRTPEAIKVIDQAGADMYAFQGMEAAALSVDIYTGKPTTRRSPSLARYPNTVAVTADLAKVSDRALLPSGGVTSGFDVIELTMVGASLVGPCSIIYEDIDIAKKMLKQIEKYMVMQALDSLDQIRGVTLKHIPEKQLDYYEQFFLFKGVPNFQFQESIAKAAPIQQKKPELTR